MVALQDGEEEQISQLRAYVDAQAEFHQKCVEVLREASASLSRKAQEASSRPKHAYTPSHGGDSYSAPTPAASVPAYGAPSDSYQPAAAPYQAAPDVRRAVPPPPPARATNQQRCTALYDFAGEGSGELTFHAGDQINITNMVNAEWYQARLSSTPTLRQY